MHAQTIVCSHNICARIASYHISTEQGMTAYAQQLYPQNTDPWYQSLEIAHSKVQAALSPGAVGHGVPELHNMSTNDILVLLGLSALGFMAVYIAVKVLLRYLKEGKVNLAIRCNGKMI